MDVRWESVETAATQFWKSFVCINSSDIGKSFYSDVLVPHPILKMSDEYPLEV